MYGFAQLSIIAAKTAHYIEIYNNMGFLYFTKITLELAEQVFRSTLSSIDNSGDGILV